MSKACRELVTTSRLQAFALGSLTYGVERVLDIGKAGNDCFTVSLQQLVLLALLQIEIAEKLTPMENRLSQAGRGRVNDRFWPQQ